MSENGKGIIFGATGFIGSQVAHKMTKKGVKLILHGKSKKKLEKLDDDLKQNWLDSLFSNKDDIFAVFDDRQKVVDMWRSNGLNVFQVADGNF